MIRGNKYLDKRDNSLECHPVLLSKQVRVTFLGENEDELTAEFSPKGTITLDKTGQALLAKFETPGAKEEANQPPEPPP